MNKVLPEYVRSTPRQAENNRATNGFSIVWLFTFGQENEEIRQNSRYQATEILLPV